MQQVWLIHLSIYFFFQYKCARRIQYQLHAGLLPGHLSHLTLKETSPLSSLPRLLKKWRDNLSDVDIQRYKSQDVSLPFTSSLSSTSVDIDRKTVNGLFLFFPPTQSHKEPFKMINEIFPAMSSAISDLPKESLKVNTRSASSRFTITFIKY